MENSWKMEEFTAQEIHKKKEDKKKILYTAPAAYNSFLGRLYGLYPKTNDEGGTA